MQKYTWPGAVSVLALILANVAVAASAARPQTLRTAPDEAWLAWVGCWRADGDASDNMLCIVPDGAGVRMMTMAGRTVRSESRIVANNQPAAVNEAGCSGTETARWSADQERVFISAELKCGERLTRRMSGVFAMLATHWVNVQSVSSGGATDTRTIRYVAVNSTDLPDAVAQALRNNRLARETARDAAAAPLDLTDVREAVTFADASTVEAWLTAVNQGFDLNGKKLVQLAKAGVPASVIDVMVALSNPGHFAVRERLASENEGRTRRGRGRGRGSDPCWGDSYGYGGRSLYDPFDYRHGYHDGCGGGGSGYYPGYGGYGGGYGGGYYGPTVIVIERSGSDDSSSGKVTREGYTKGRSSEDSGARDRQPTTTSTPSTSKPATPKSSGGSSSGSTRKAHPRDQ